MSSIESRNHLIVLGNEEIDSGVPTTLAITEYRSIYLDTLYCPNLETHKSPLQGLTKD